MKSWADKGGTTEKFAINSTPAKFMAQQHFDIKDTDPLLIYGVNDQHLQALSETFSVQLLARSGRITIDGEQAAVWQVEQVLRDMIITINRKGSLSPEDVAALARLSPDGNGHQVHDEKQVILYTHRGEVTPRTPGPAKHYQAPPAHDPEEGVCGIRTHDSPCDELWFSRPVRSTRLRQHS